MNRRQQGCHDGRTEPPKQVLGHSYLRERVAEECARVERGGSSFALLRIEGMLGDAAIADTLPLLLRRADVLAVDGPSAYEILLINVSEDQAVSAAARIVDSLVQAGSPVRSGLACYPGDGSRPDDLFAATATAMATFPASTLTDAELSTAFPAGAAATTGTTADSAANATDSVTTVSTATAATVSAALDSRSAAAAAAGADAGAATAARSAVRPARLTSVRSSGPRTTSLLGLLERVAASDFNVLLLGEPGVGKGAVAEMIHRCSRRSDGPFVGLSCSGIDEDALESSLFGNEGVSAKKQATRKCHPGLLEVGSGGTVFLEEIMYLSSRVQARLLRAVQEEASWRIGGRQPRPIDVRIIASASNDAGAALAEGSFNRQLFCELNGFSVVVPALRRRKQEIGEWAEVFLTDACRGQLRSTVPAISGQAMEALLSYHWPDNLPELRNAMRHAALCCDGNEVMPSHLPELVWRRAPEQPATNAAQRAQRGRRRPIRANYRRVAATLNKYGGNQTKAAEALGVSRRTLSNWLDSLPIPRPRKK
ncbi:MAG: sigma 54-interacting transcriptional regulator [Pseudomonadota bacterium]